MISQECKLNLFSHFENDLVPDGAEASGFRFVFDTMFHLGHPVLQDKVAE